MPTITGLVPSPDRPGYVLILVDGKPFATVPAENAERLAEGGDAGDAERFLPLKAATQKTYERALNLLSFRARSAKELGKRLREKGEPAEEIDAVLTRLLQNGLLDDARYAESKARSGIVGKARSRRRMQQDLAQRGVAREVVDKAITTAYAEEGTSELAVAERAARKKMRSLGRHDAQEQKQKLYAFLARQGYPGDVVRKVMKRVLEATVDEEPE